MQIIIVGCGNVGRTLAEQLSKEGHSITVIDKDSQKVEYAVNHYDAMGVVGNGASFYVQNEAGIENADLLIAVTNSDELNLLCCLVAKKVGDCNTIARVRNPIYNKEVEYFKEELGLSMIINPEYTAALDISRLLKVPSAISIDSFAKGRVDLLKCKIVAGSPICNCALIDISSKLRCEVLVCAVERGEQVYIPDGKFVLKENDVISIVASPRQTHIFFKKMGMAGNRIKSVMIVGGGETSFYLTQMLLAIGMNVTIIEKDKPRCKELSELLPKAVVIHGDGTERNLLQEQGLEQMKAFVAWTDLDEENVMLSLFAKHVSKAKTITKVNRIAYNEIIDKLDLGSVLYPKHITAEYIIRYVRAMNNSIGSNVETLYRLCDDKVEALEFYVKKNSAVIGIPLKDLQLKENLLICCINRKGAIITPGGQSTIEEGDTVIVVTTNTGFDDLEDILKD